MKRIILKPGEERRILGGHPWVYNNETARILAPIPGGFKPIEPEELEGGELADVESSGKTYLGRAFVNPRSKIIARIYSPSKEGVDKGFFKRRIREAINRRFTVPHSPGPWIGPAGYDLYRESARLVFGEADFLPGLVIDRFVGWPFENIEAAFKDGGSPEAGFSGTPLTFERTESVLGPPSSWLSVQFLAWGMDSRREEILAALEEVLGRAQSGIKTPNRENSGEDGENPAVKIRPPLGTPAGIVERSSAKVRELEGLPLRSGLIRGSFPAGGIVIFENGFPFIVHLEEGQKTGHYLDQKENHLRTAAFAAGARVLDLCAYTGGFGIHAARYNAASVTAVDSSAGALATAQRNALLNGAVNRFVTLEADVFELLRSYERAKERFDLLILDPPAFAKSRSVLEGALRGYKEINLQAIKLLSPGGVLVSCSCSQALPEDRFKAMIGEAAADAGRRIVQLDFRYQAADHPILIGYDESFYLKCGYYRVL
jgi:23S rRNA (cytosine1962-C5)-methyltransferase